MLFNLDDDSIYHIDPAILDGPITEEDCPLRVVISTSEENPRQITEIRKLQEHEQ
jgi:hypothetical protein